VAVLGVDGWRGAWVGALLDGRSVRILHLASMADVLAVPDVAVVGIDMPIGLSEDGLRACDLEARRRLSGTGASSTVFPAPVRQVLAADSYVQARGLAVAASRRSISAQSWNLVPSIRQVDDALGDPPTERLVEVHPELAFRALDARVRDRKALPRGQAQRIRALLPAMDVLDALAEAPAGVPVVDALDACAVAWSARRIADGTAECVGDSATDARGRPMRICW
jgi:predicted RNase H-like nuclease